MNLKTRQAAHRAYAADLRARKRLRRQRAEIHAALERCQAKAKTRRRSVEKLMAERGWTRLADSGPIETQWAKS